MSSPVLPRKCFDCLSTKHLTEHGVAMVSSGWKVEYGTSYTGQTEYRWVSPRGEVYHSYAINVPHFRAVEDAVKHNDYPCVPL